MRKQEKDEVESEDEILELLIARIMEELKLGCCNGSWMRGRQWKKLICSTCREQTIKKMVAVQGKEVMNFAAINTKRNLAGAQSE